jgi:GR25 family glycosyltransferase involved in LPS biosynthesis
MTQPSLFVISQSNSFTSQHQTAITVQLLTQWQWQYNIHPATDGHSLDSAIWNTLGIASPGESKFLYRRGAQGCFISHYTLWQHCVSLGQPIIILEHDARAQQTWDMCISIKDDQILKLHSDLGVKFNPDSGHWGKGAWAYAIGPGAADKLLHHSKKQVMPADIIIGTNIVDWSYLSAPMFVHDAGDFRSTTSGMPAFLKSKFNKKSHI